MLRRHTPTRAEGAIHYIRHSRVGAEGASLRADDAAALAGLRAGRAAMTTIPSDAIPRAGARRAPPVFCAILLLFMTCRFLA